MLKRLQLLERPRCLTASSPAELALLSAVTTTGGCELKVINPHYLSKSKPSLRNGL